MRRSAVLAGVLAFTVLGGVLRFDAVDFGLPDRFRPDEQWVVPHGLHFDPGWNPGFAIYPAAQMYVQHAALRAWAALAAPPAQGWRDYYAPDGGARAYLVARRVSAAMGAATIPLVYAAASSAFGAPGGLAAAAIVALCPLHVRDSKFATTDVAMVFWITFALWMTVRIERRGGLGDYAAAGALGGLAAASKYPAAVIVFAIVAAHLSARHREGRSLLRSWRDFRIFVALYAFVAAFALATPYVFIDWQRTLASFEYQRGSFLRTSNPFQDGSGWPWLLGHALPDGFGPEITILLLAGVAWAAARRPPGAIPALTLVGFACLTLTRSASVYYRYVLPLLPPLAMLAGGLVADAASRLPRPREPRRRAALVSAALAAALTPALARDLRLNALLARPDTRTLARQWIADNIPPESRIAVTDLPNPAGKPELPRSYEIVPFRGVEAARREGTRWVLSDSEPELVYFSPGPSEADLAELDRAATLVYDLDPVVAAREGRAYDRADAFYAPLRGIDGVRQPGPRIRIWRLD